MTSNFGAEETSKFGGSATFGGASTSADDGQKADEWKRGPEAFADIPGAGQWQEHMIPGTTSLQPDQIPPPQNFKASSSTAGAGAGGQDRTAQIARHGTQELWQAVHVGDQAAVDALIQQGLCNGAMMDPRAILCCGIPSPSTM